jgi:hypothetical protein
MALEFITLTDLLGIPYNNAKDEYRQKILILKYLLDINIFEISILDEKIIKIRYIIDDAL